jgi:hypothetical protein
MNLIKKTDFFLLEFFFLLEHIYNFVNALCFIKIETKIKKIILTN